LLPQRQSENSAEEALSAFRRLRLPSVSRTSWRSRARLSRGRINALRHDESWRESFMSIGFGQLAQSASATKVLQINEPHRRPARHRGRHAARNTPRHPPRGPSALREFWNAVGLSSRTGILPLSHPALTSVCVPPRHHTGLYRLPSRNAPPRAVRPKAEIGKGVGADMVFAQQFTGLIGRRSAFARKCRQPLSPGGHAFAHSFGVIQAHVLPSSSPVLSTRGGMYTPYGTKEANNRSNR